MDNQTLIIAALAKECCDLLRSAEVTATVEQYAANDAATGVSALDVEANFKPCRRLVPDEIAPVDWLHSMRHGG